MPGPTRPQNPIMRVLHVENDAASATAVREMLRGSVEECVWAELGESALEIARDQEFDLILLDVMLPDIDGYEVASRLRDQGVNTPFLILSGLVDRDSEFSTLAFGVSDYLLKPFSRTELINRIQSIVARASGLGGEQEIARPPTGDRKAGADDARKFRRFTTIKSARIDYGSGVPCRIVNMSHAGAGLRLLEAPEKLPRSFMLVLDSGETHFCRVSWRDGDRMGVKFIDQTG